MAKADKKDLRKGFTTGTAAAAATKGALTGIIEGVFPRRIDIRLLTDQRIEIPVHSVTRMDENSALCSVIKDAGDDPDATHRAEIGARVRYETGPERLVLISGGRGVGRVTKPGLETPVGEPAITKGPRRMIREAVLEVLRVRGLKGKVTTEIFVPHGVALAKKTLNKRLGIVGGISILGTTGVVTPISHEAYMASMDAALSVARAAGLERAVLNTGRRGEKYSREWFKELPEEAFVQMGDFFKGAMTKAAEKGFCQVILAVFFGKAVKMSLGVPHTHAAKSELTLKRLSRWAMEVTNDAALERRIASANTARHALGFILPDYPSVVQRVGEEMVKWACKFANQATKRVISVRGVIYGFDGKIIFDSKGMTS